ncbi:LOW QUALITY PROTEIN: hypothetical protein N665_0188s0346 [Sinapis alba]|nr:LOW QUALITY PROTEIN: hypothetical protein N665_0188s0346 [Sinapis alba]
MRLILLFLLSLTEAAAIPDDMDLMTAFELILRKSCPHGGVPIEVLIEKRSLSYICVLVEDCNQPDFVKLVKALCADHNNINLLYCSDAKTLTEWAGAEDSLFSTTN